MERDPLDTQEAIRLIVMKIRVTKLEAPGKDDGQELPVVHFSGTSRSMHSSWDPNANSVLEGKCSNLEYCLAADNENLRHCTPYTTGRSSMDNLEHLPWVSHRPIYRPHSRNSKMKINWHEFQRASLAQRRHTSWWYPLGSRCHWHLV